MLGNKKMKTLLFIGGTRFFGKKLVKKLLDSQKYHITLLTRGNSSPKEFENRVEYIFCDRTDSARLDLMLNGKCFDIVVDNIVYTGASDVKTILDVLEGKIGHYLLCSSGAIYPSFGLHEWNENEAILDLKLEADEYTKNKRETEIELLKYKNVPFTIYRPTVIQGQDDFSQRTRFFIEKILRQEKFNIPDNVILKHVYSQDLVDAVEKLIQLTPQNLAYNIAGDDKISLEEYCHRVANVLGMKSSHETISNEKFLLSKEKDFPKAYARSLLLSNILIKEKIEYYPTSIENWLPATVNYILKN